MENLESPKVHKYDSKIAVRLRRAIDQLENGQLLPRPEKSHAVSESVDEEKDEA